MTTKSTIPYETPPEQVKEALTTAVMVGFANMNNAIFVSARSLPKLINRQTFCLLTGSTVSEYRKIIKNGEIKPIVRDTGKKCSYDITKEEFIKYYKQLKTNHGLFNS